MTTGVKKFIEENIDLIESEDFKTLESKAAIRTSDYGYDKACMYEILLTAGINPLPYLNEVPYAFLRGTSLEGSFTVPGNCIDIEARAFYECSLSEIIIEEGVESIGPLACARSDKLEKVYIPSSILDLGNNIFIGCKNLREVIYDGIYADFERVYSHASTPHPWFGAIPTLVSTNCILKCKDQDVSLRIDI